MRALLSYYWRWLKIAIVHPYGVADILSTIIGLLAPLVARLHPEWKDSTTDLVWQIPLCAAAMVFLRGLFMAPYWMHRELVEQVAALDTSMTARNDRLRLREEVGELIAMARYYERRTLEKSPDIPNQAQEFDQRVRQFLSRLQDQTYAQLWSTATGHGVQLTTDDKQAFKPTDRTSPEYLRRFRAQREVLESCLEAHPALTL